MRKFIYFSMFVGTFLFLGSFFVFSLHMWFGFYQELIISGDVTIFGMFAVVSLVVLLMIWLFVCAVFSKSERKELINDLSNCAETIYLSGWLPFKKVSKTAPFWMLQLYQGCQFLLWVGKLFLLYFFMGFLFQLATESGMTDKNVLISYHIFTTIVFLYIVGQFVIRFYRGEWQLAVIGGINSVIVWLFLCLIPTIFDRLGLGSIQLGFVIGFSFFAFSKGIQWLIRKDIARNIEYKSLNFFENRRSFFVDLQMISFGKYQKVLKIEKLITCQVPIVVAQRIDSRGKDIFKGKRDKTLVEYQATTDIVVKGRYVFFNACFSLVTDVVPKVCSAGGDYL
ncbi:TPA: hypothetical protein ACOW33_001618 [Enterococcus faecalis]|uniref:hypothetical protein n=1 Tax=Enterococcus faecalis TaxID=1351 RepID=UPI00398419FE